MLKLIFLLALLNFSSVLSESKTEAEVLVDYINSLQTTWKADFNFDKHISPSKFKYLCGSLKTSESILPTKNVEVVKDLPDTFDARDQWPNCPSISDVRDQGSCGSCWAHGSTEAISDRICIQSNGESQPIIGAEYVNSCCNLCGSGCNGGYPAMVWKSWVNDGLVTGGGYNSSSGCQPYEIPQCSHHINGTYPSCGDEENTPTCVSNSCTNSKYQTTFIDDIHFGKKAYGISKNVEQIQTDIFQNGPVSANYNVYEDFLYYTSGVYQHQSGAPLGGHTVKILGWGTEDGTPYWLVVNSWNEEWGDKGYFKILRGSNECGIESGINAGV